MKFLRDKSKSQSLKKALSCAMALFIIFQSSAPTAYAASKEMENRIVHKDLKVAVLSDPHYYPEEYIQNTDGEDHNNYMAKELYLLAESSAIFKSALDMVEKDNPDLLLIPGDMTKNSEKLAYEEISEILKDFEEKTGIDVLVVNGNHDVYHGGFRFDENGNMIDLTDDQLATTEEYYEFMKEFGFNGEFNAEYFQEGNNKEAALSYVARPKDGFVILSLNSQLYKYDENGNVVGQDGAGFSEELLNWAVNQIKKAEENGETVIAMSHHGIIPHSKASELLDGNAIVNNWEDVATTLADAGLRYIFTGHMHENDIAEYTTANGNTLYDIETTATAAYGSPVRSVEFKKGTKLTSNSPQTRETVEVSSKSVKTIEYRGQSIDNLQDYIYDSIYKDSKYLEIKLGGALEPLVEKIANINLYDLIYGQTQVSEFGMADRIEEELGKALGGKKIEVEDKGTYILQYDNNSKSVVSTSNNSKGIEDKINIDRFLKDIVKQIDDKVLEKDVLKNEISNIITAIMNIEVYNADTVEKKVLRDVVNLFLIDHFVGAEDLSGWPEELIDQMKTGEGISELIDNLISNLLELLPSLLKKVEVNAKTLTDDFILQVGINALLGKDKSLTNFLSLVGVNVVDIIKAPLGEYLDKYITPSFEKQMGTLLADLIYGLAGDDTQDDEIDGASRVIKYNGQMAQEPTIENGLLPHSVAVTFGEDETTEKAFSWYTGKYVKANEIQFVKESEAKKDSKGNVSFENAKVVQANSEVVSRKFPTIDLGLIAISKDKDVTRHQVVLEGLEPGTKYYYKVGTGNIFTSVGEFETAQVEDDNFTFLHVSDTQSMLEEEYEIWSTVVDAAFNRFPDAKFLTHAGDMIDNGDNELQWQWFLNKPQEDLMSTTMLPTSGNHESMGDSSMVEHFNIQDMPSQDTTTGAYYKVDYGNTLVMVLNTENLVNDALNQEQIDWLIETSEESDAKWKVIQLHKAPYSNGSHYEDSDVVAIREQLDPIVTELGIDLVLQGHDHLYARSEFLVDGEIEENLEKTEISKDGITYETAVNPEGTMYVITGTSGVKFYQPNETDLPIAFSPEVNLPVFAGLTVEDDTLYYSAYTVDPDTGKQSLLDKYAIQKEDTVEDVVNKEELTTLVEEAKLLDESKYTEESFAKLQIALKEAEAILSKEDATQEEVDAVKLNLQTAIDELTEKEVVEIDKSELTAIIENAENLEEDKYTEESYARLKEELEASKALLEKEDVTQEEIDTAKSNLEKAIEELEEKTSENDKEEVQVDKSELSNLLEEAKLLDESKYTEESFVKFKLVLEEVKAVLENEDATQEEVDLVKANLQLAIDGLEVIEDDEDKEEEEVPVDKSELTTVIENAEKLDESKYTEDSFKKLQESLISAKDILEKEDATQEEVDTSKTNLQSAIDELKEIENEEVPVDKSELTIVIDNAEKVDESKYTEDSFEKLQKALILAKELLEKENATQEEVDAAKTSLQKAINELKEKEESVIKPEDTTKPDDITKPEDTLDSEDTPDATESGTSSNKDNPKTSDNSMMGYIGLGIASLAALVGIRRKKNK